MPASSSCGASPSFSPPRQGFISTADYQGKKTQLVLFINGRSGALAAAAATHTHETLCRVLSALAHTACSGPPPCSGVHAPEARH